MALVSVNEGSGDFMPIVKYDSRAGRIFRVDREDGTSNPVDITRTFKAIFDFNNVEVGYILFRAGGAPDFRMAPYGAVMPPPPTGDYKQGVRLRIKLSKECGGDMREMAGTANAFLRGINAVHDEYLKLSPGQAGKLPVVVLTDTIAVESGGGAKRSTNYQPVFSIAGWALRPSDMPGVEQPKAATSQMATPRTVQPTPAATAAAASDDFG